MKIYFAEKIKTLRQERGISQEKLAQYLPYLYERRKAIYTRQKQSGGLFVAPRPSKTGRVRQEGTSGSDALPCEPSGNHLSKTNRFKNAHPHCCRSESERDRGDRIFGFAEYRTTRQCLASGHWSSVGDVNLPRLRARFICTTTKKSASQTLRFNLRSFWCDRP